MLADGELLCIFHAGSAPGDGALQTVQDRVVQILQRRAVPVVPVALHALPGSPASPVDAATAPVRPLRRRLFSRVALVVGPPLAPHGLSPDALRQQLAQLLQARHPGVR